MSFPQVHTIVCVSMAHLPYEVAYKMECREYLGGFRYEVSSQGYRVYTESETAPVEIAPIIEAARDFGALYIEFTSEGPVLDGFRTWDW